MIVGVGVCSTPPFISHDDDHPLKPLGFASFFDYSGRGNKIFLEIPGSQKDGSKGRKALAIQSKC